MGYVVGHYKDGRFIEGPPAPFDSSEYIIRDYEPDVNDIFITVPRYQSGTLDPLSDAIAWAIKNPDAWHTLVEWAHRDVENGGRPSIGLYAELLRRPHFANLLRLQRTDTAFLINNNLRSSLARLLNREYPTLKIPTREASVDRWTMTNP